MAAPEPSREAPEVPEPGAKMAAALAAAKDAEMVKETAVVSKPMHHVTHLTEHASSEECAGS